VAWTSWKKSIGWLCRTGALDPATEL